MKVYQICTNGQIRIDYKCTDYEVVQEKDKTKSSMLLQVRS